MVEIAPFRGIRYDADIVSDLSTVVAPPYDVISPAERDALEAASPYNVVRLILGEEEPGDDEKSNKYTRARALLETWTTAGVLRKDDAPALYLYEMSSDVEGAPHVMRGILAAVSLDEPGAGGVLPHEKTYDAVVGDRLDLLRATGSNLEPVFLVYDGKDGRARTALESAASGDPLVKFDTPDGVSHRLWSIDDPSTIDTISRAIAKTPLLIADGHHRWKTAQTYRDERRSSEGAGPWDAHLAFLVDVGRAGPALRPIHRVLPDVAADEALPRMRGSFNVEILGDMDPEDVVSLLAERRATQRVFALVGRDRAWLLTVADHDAERKALPGDRSDAWRDLDVAVLHEWIFGKLLAGAVPSYVHTATEAVDQVRSGKAGCAFLLAPTPFESVRAVAQRGEAMPQKSTYFVPKPKTGLVMRPLD